MKKIAQQKTRTKSKTVTKNAPAPAYYAPAAPEPVEAVPSTLGDLRLTPMRAFGLYQCTEEATRWGDRTKPISFHEVHRALGDGSARTLHDSFAMLVVLVTSESFLDGESEGDVLALAWEVQDNAPLRSFAFPEVRRIGYMHNGAFFDVVDMEADSAVTFPLKREVA